MRRAQEETLRAASAGPVGRRKAATIRGLTTIKWRNKGRRETSFRRDNARSSLDRNELRLVLKSPLLPVLDDERCIKLFRVLDREQSLSVSYCVETICFVPRRSCVEKSFATLYRRVCSWSSNCRCCVCVLHFFGQTHLYYIQISTNK